MPAAQPPDPPAMAMPLRLLRRLVDVHAGEAGALLAGFAYFFCLLCGYYLLRPLRDALGLAGGAGQLQWLFTATFIVMLLLVPVFGLLAQRWPPRRFVAVIYRFFALNILCFGALFALGVQELAAARVFFVWISVYNLFVVSIFWSVLADHFSSEQGRRLFGFIAAGGTAGALVGPAAAALLAGIGVAWLAVLAALLLEGALQCCRRLERAAPGSARALGRREALGGDVLAGIRLVLREPYLRGIVAYLLLHSFASTFLYIEQGRIVAGSLSDTAARTRLFASADLAVSCMSILLQLAVTGRLLRRFGVMAGLVLLPLAGMAAFAAIAFWPMLGVLVAAQSLRRSVDYALSRPAREVLFTVVSREAKYKAKSVIETVVYRVGRAELRRRGAAVAGAGSRLGRPVGLAGASPGTPGRGWHPTGWHRARGPCACPPPGAQMKNPLHEIRMSRARFLRLAAGATAALAVPALPAQAAVTGQQGRMHARPIPSSGERLGVIGCGTWQTFDVGTAEADRQRLADVLQILFDAGGSVVDSSPMYGRSEAVTGDLLTRLGAHDRAFVATKVWTRGGDAGVRQMEESMRLLQHPRIELMQVHNLLDWRTHLRTLRAWKDAGRIKYLGITHYTVSAFDDLEAIMRAEQLDFVQLNYSLDDRAAEARLLPLAAERGIAVLVNQPFGGGGLLRGLAGKPLPAWAGDIGCASWAQVLLKYVVSHPSVICAIPGTSRPQHMSDNVAAGAGVMPDQAMRRRMAADWQRR